MTTTPDDIWTGVAAERTTLVELLDSLAAPDWDHPSLCAGWRVRDVVAHVILSSNPTVATLLPALVRARGNIDRLNRDTAIRHADRTSPRQLSDELRAVIPARVAAIGTNPTDRLMDVLVHIQDITLPLGLTREMSTDSARLAIDRVLTSRWFRQVQRRFSEYRLVATDIEWAVGTGPVIEGRIADLLLLTTGRTARLSALSGAGAALLDAR
ncbi:maleylpyruvate isomerase family mycothiol-dependent enzyme [Nocardia sp. NPDC050406]|uniref:maleylpyruvate isomerase family mycothiol-dependent enzyme n=1 Tax=Nocardia sp. NPDC050406 TaxID=3364318 RepID=UPI00379822EC